MQTRRVVAIATVATALIVLLPAATPAAGGALIEVCGQTVTTNAILTQDLMCYGMSGVVVDASGITVDLKGFEIRGNNTAGRWGVDVTGGYDDVTIKNGAVEGFDYGIAADNGADRLSIQGLTAVGNAERGISVVGDKASVKAVVASQNGVTGISVQGDFASIQSSTASANGQYGVFVIGDAAVVKSAAASAEDAGIRIDGDQAIVQASEGSNNVSVGVEVAGTGASVKSSKASFNGINGFEIEGDGATLKGNRADGNGYANAHVDSVGVGIGVFLYSVPPVGSGNSASYNDNQAQCAPASIC